MPWWWAEPPPVVIVEVEDPRIVLAKQIGIQAAAIIVAVITLYISYKLLQAITWSADRTCSIVCIIGRCLWALLGHLATIVVNLGRVVTGITILGILSCLIWIYTQGPSFQSFAHLELLYRFYKETTGHLAVLPG